MSTWRTRNFMYLYAAVDFIQSTNPSTRVPSGVLVFELSITLGFEPVFGKLM